MRDLICTNVRREGDAIPCMELTNEEVSYVLGLNDEELRAALIDEESAPDVRLRFEIERTRRELGL